MTTQMSNDAYHEPALLDESVHGLSIQQEGIYVDCTFGGGGHARAILARLSGEGRLYAFDQDKAAEKNAIDDGRFTFIHANFKNLESFLKMHNAIPVDGIVADLGVSSHHINVAERGFSTRHNAPLDMRMNQAAELNAAQVVNDYAEKQLATIIREYGELPGGRIAKALVQSRPISTTAQLRDVAMPFAGKRPEKFFAKLFQAIRIEVNQELDALKALLEQSVRLLRERGRLVIISYHSLEDRLVKNYMLRGSFSGEVTTDEFGNQQKPFKAITRKPIRPKEPEVVRNPRARSARLRIAQKL